MQMPRLKKVIPIVLLSLPGVYFVLVGFSKFAGPAWVDMFRGWGYPDGFVYIIGASEILLGVGTIITKFRAISAAGLAVIMIGASATHLIHESVSSSLLSLVMLTICSGIAFFSYRRSGAKSGAPLQPQTD